MYLRFQNPIYFRIGRYIHAILTWQILAEAKETWCNIFIDSVNLKSQVYSIQPCKNMKTPSAFNSIHRYLISVGLVWVSEISIKDYVF